MDDKLSQMLKYNRSKENAEKIEPFIQLAQRFILLAKQYANAYKELYANVLKEEYRREYAKGGVTIHRGFYSPSSLDIITGGCNRGRLLKRTPRGANYDYEYIFNDRGDLICCRCHNRIEILVYQEDYVLGLEFLSNENYLLERISQCWYEDAKLTKYVCVLFDYYDKDVRCEEINMETFDYTDSLLKKVNWYRYTPAIKLLTHEEIILYRDETGNLLEYVFKEIDLPPWKETMDIPEQRYTARKKGKLFHDTHHKGQGDGSPVS